MELPSTIVLATTQPALLPCILLALSLIGCAAGSDAREPFSADPRTAQRAWHAERLRALTAEDGWLTLVGLDFLADGTATIGTAPECTLRYAGAGAVQAGRFEVEGARVTFTPAPGATWTLDGSPLTISALLDADDAGAPSILRRGPLMITLVRRNGALALRIRDNDSPVRHGFAGIELFPYAPALVAAARVEPPAAGERVAVTNVTGFVEEQPVAARLRFELAGQTCSLVATAGAGGRLFVVFGDPTNGYTTYGGGRFLDVPAPVDGRTTLDFNRATNPPCSFTAFATCPTPPAGNRLPVPVVAGERMPARVGETSTGR